MDTVETMKRMPYQLTGFSIPWFGLQWTTKKTTDKKIAQGVIGFLEDRRVLFGRCHSKDEMHCVLSALQIRSFLTERLTNDEMGDDLTNALKAMRATARKFVEAATGSQDLRAGHGVRRSPRSW
jgi:hypothetical protein